MILSDPSKTNVQPFRKIHRTEKRIFFVSGYFGAIATCSLESCCFYVGKFQYSLNISPLSNFIGKFKKKMQFSNQNFVGRMQK